MQRRRGTCNRRGIARPGVRVEGVVTGILISRAMELRRPCLRDDADLGPGRPAVFRRIIRGENLDFLCRVYIGRTNAGAVRTRSGGGSSIERDQVLRIARAVEI